MAINYIHGTSGHKVGTGNLVLPSLSVTPGNALIVSIGVYCGVTSNGTLGGLTVSDSTGNVWTLVCTSPVIHRDSPFNDSLIATFIALDVVGGSTTVTVHTNGTSINVSLDEYSGVASSRAIGAVNFEAIPYGTSPVQTSVDSGDIEVISGQLVYSVAWAQNAGETLTPSVGFTQRSSDNSGNGSITSFDSSSTGTVNNVVTASSTPDTVHVVIFALSPSPIGLILQTGYSINAGITGPNSVDTDFPFDVHAGNLLILSAYVHERINMAVTDTQGNLWTVVEHDPNIMAYTTASVNGPLTVTMTASGGGDDVAWNQTVHEYDIQNTVFSASAFNSQNDSNPIDTGNVSVNTDTSILISSVTLNFPEVPVRRIDSSTETSPAIPSNWRYQISDSGFFGVYLNTICLADQTGLSPGTYSNVFSPDNGPLDKTAIILGFDILTTLTLSCASSFAEIGVPYDSFLVASGGTHPYTFSIIDGALPPGLALNTSTGEISGTPTTGGNYTYTAQVTDSGSPVQTATVTCTIFVPCFLVDWPLPGPYLSPTGTPLSNGSLSVRLVFDCNCPCADYQITGNNHVIMPLDEDGIVIDNPQVRPNDQLKPDGSYYILQAYSAQGELVLGPRTVYITSD